MIPWPSDPRGEVLWKLQEIDMMEAQIRQRLPGN